MHPSHREPSLLGVHRTHVADARSSRWTSPVSTEQIEDTAGETYVSLGNLGFGLWRPTQAKWGYHIGGRFD